MLQRPPLVTWDETSSIAGGKNLGNGRPPLAAEISRHSGLVAALGLAQANEATRSQRAANIAETSPS